MTLLANFEYGGPPHGGGRGGFGGQGRGRGDRGGGRGGPDRYR